MRRHRSTRAVVSRLAGKIREAGLALPQCHLFFLELFTSLLRLTRGAGLEMESVRAPAAASGISPIAVQGRPTPTVRVRFR